MPPPPDFSIIIVNFEGERYLSRLLRSIFSQKGASFEVLVVDNHSSDQSMKILEKYKKRIRLLPLAQNEGFARGNNLAYAKSRGRYVFFLNNDTFLYNDRLLHAALSYFQSHPNMGVLQPTILRPDGRLDSSGVFFTPLGFIDDEGYGSLLPTRPIDQSVWGVRGAGFFSRREVIEQVGLFDECFFCYWEEYDFCVRALRFGWDIRYASIPGLVHFDQGHAPDPGKKRHFWKMVYSLSFPNQVRSYVKNMGLAEGCLVLPCLAFCQFASSIVLSILNLKNFTYPLLAGYGAILRDWPALRAQRAAISHHSKISFLQTLPSRTHPIPWGMFRRISKNW